MNLPPVLVPWADRLTDFGDAFAATADRRFAWAEDTRKATIVLLVGHVLVWTLYCVLSHGNLADSVDMVENWNWGKEWQWGYYKHPPFFAWVTGAWFALFPRADWAYYMLSATSAAVGLAGVHALCGAAAREGEAIGRRRLAAVAGLALTPIYGFLAIKFNANAILLAVWPWAAWAFLVALRRPTAFNGAVLGLLLAVAMLSKYSSLVLVIAMAVAILVDADRRRLITSPAAVAAVVVGLAAFAPHVAQMASTNFVTLSYADHQRANSVGQFFDYLTRFPLSQLLFQLPILSVLLVALPIVEWRSLRSFFDFADPARRRLLVLGTVPFVAMTALGVIKWAKLTSQWGFPMWFASGWLVAGSPAIAESRLRPSRIAALAALVWAVLLVTAVPTNIIGTLSHQIVHIEPRAELGREVTRVWHEATGGKRLAVVSGSFPLMHNVGFYSPDDPSTLIDFDYAKSPWLTPEKVAVTGVAVVCEVDPEEITQHRHHRATGDCEARAREVFGEDLQEREIEVAKHWYGTTLRPFRFLLLMRLPHTPA